MLPVCELNDGTTISTAEDRESIQQAIEDAVQELRTSTVEADESWRRGLENWQDKLFSIS